MKRQPKRSRKAKAGVETAGGRRSKAEIDEAILHCIKRNPKILLKNIPDDIEKAEGPAAAVSYPTVLRHVNKLTEDEVIERRFSINWAKGGYLVRYRVGILIEPVALRSGPGYASQAELADYIMNTLVKDERFNNNLVVDDVYILLGGTVDLVIDFFAKEDKTATQFIIDALRNLPGIRDTGSAKIAYSAKFGWLSKNGGA